MTEQIACRVWATIIAGYLPLPGSVRHGDDEHAEWLARFRSNPAVPAWIANWRPESSSRTEDEESQEAYAAWKGGDAHAWMPPAAILWPAQVPLMIDHLSVPVGVLNTATIEIKDNEIKLRGWADPDFQALLQERPFASPSLTPARMRLNRIGGFLFAEMTDVDIWEISATATPALDGTAFGISAPQRVPLGEFHELTPMADRMTFANVARPSAKEF